MLLSVEQIAVRYSNGALGVTNVSLNVEAGEVVAIFGVNGAGKTTTLRAITGFMKSERARVVSGSIGLMGKTISNYEPHQCAALGIGYVPDKNKIFRNLSVVENLQVAAGRMPRKQRKQALSRIYEVFPPLSQRPKERAGRLSGGQQQMLAIGRALMSNVRLLVIDDITLGLHHSIHYGLFHTVRQVANEGTAVLFVDESVGPALSITDRCYLLSAGTVRAAGPPSEFTDKLAVAAGFIDA